MNTGFASKIGSCTHHGTRLINNLGLSKFLVNSSQKVIAYYRDLIERGLKYSAWKLIHVYLATEMKLSRTLFHWIWLQIMIHRKSLETVERKTTIGVFERDSVKRKVRKTHSGQQKFNLENFESVWFLPSFFSLIDFKTYKLMSTLEILCGSTEHTVPLLVTILEGRWIMSQASRTCICSYGIISRLFRR